MGKLAHEREAEALELVLLDELVEIHAEQFEGEADVVAEGEVVYEVDDVVRVFSVLLPQVLQDADLLVGLTVEAFLVADDLDRHVLLGLVIVGLQHLAETAPA